MSTNDLDPSSADAAVGKSSGVFGVRYTAGEAIVQGAPVCLKDASGTTKAYNGDGNGSGTLKDVIGCASANIASGAVGFIVRLGFCLAPSTVWGAAPAASDAGKPVYASNTAGKLTITATTAGAIGVMAVDADGNLGIEVGCIGSALLPY